MCNFMMFNLSITINIFNLYRWTFLELLGFFSFFGVALIDTKSSVMSLGICMITVFSISIMSYVIADLDNPFSGFFRLDLSLFDESLQHGRQCYQDLKARVAGMLPSLI